MFTSFPIADIPLFPPVASAQAPEVDALYFFLNVVTAVMTLSIFAAVIYFAFKYKRRPGVEPVQIHGSTKLELTWSIVPFLIMLVMFGWGAKIFFAEAQPPKDAVEIFVTGKQWMWKFQYPDGGREIDELHVEVGQPVKLTMASEDVIHSLSIPAFRVKHDVVPGHYDALWFTPTKPGHYHLFCTEYCGAQHAHMGGWVDVLDKSDFEKWAAGSAIQGTLAEKGLTEFEQLGCATCHLMNQQGRGPNLTNLYGKRIYLSNGSTVIADDAYIRESILDPNAKIVASFQPNIMPVFDGQISEQGINEVIAYIKSLSQPVPPSQEGSHQWQIVLAPPNTLKNGAAAKSTAVVPTASGPPASAARAAAAETKPGSVPPQTAPAPAQKGTQH
ncbi:MAG TPA: cytochrome c oxidase subunit II [Bryobacteraceae bacterium]|nr:cytochrome c oxidase subunit II [Bryobacteraceae bacterium]